MSVPVSLSCRQLLSVGLALAAMTPATAQLATRSPFVPPQASAPSGPTPGATLQYIGYMDTAEGRRFRLYDPAKKAGVWVKLNESNADFDVVVKQHDGNTLVVEHQGKMVTLAEREGKVVSSGAAGQMPVPMPVPANVSPAVTQAVVLNPTPADEQRRLEAVAAEVARRRALREQAAQQAAQGVQPQIAVPQQVQPPRQRGIPGQNFRQQR